jgi:hypothetical protein
VRRLAAILLVTAGMASAAPESSLRPEPRPVDGLTVEPSGTIAARPRGAEAERAARRGDAPDLSLRPELRPRAILRLGQERDRLRRRGAVCGDLDIQGEVVGRVAGDGVCGVENAVRIRAVSGVDLNQGAVMDCPTAKALKTWVDETARPAVGSKGGGLARLQVAAHYVCRTRNNKPGARISEHGKGRAIDISGYKLRDGTFVTVLEGWRGRDTGKILRRMHAGACGPFGTVLGPGSDGYHEDHFHFDTARHRGGPYCR